jgi:hypothetical protein
MSSNKIILQENNGILLILIITISFWFGISSFIYMIEEIIPFYIYIPYYPWLGAIIFGFVISFILFWILYYHIIGNQESYIKKQKSTKKDVSIDNIL